MNPSFSVVTDLQRQSIQTEVTYSGQAIQGSNPGVIILKLYMQSLEYDQINNFPRNGLQFVEKITGQIGFFLGMSIFSFIELILLLLLLLWMIIMTSSESSSSVHSIQKVQSVDE